MTTPAEVISIIPDRWLRFVTRQRFRFKVVDRALDWIARRTIFNRDGIIRRGKGAGLRFNPGQSAVSFVFGTHEAPVQRVLEKVLRPGAVFLDVGANVGFYSVIAARLVGGAGRVVSFEPVPTNCKCIAHNAGLNGFSQITARGEALGEAEGEAEFILSGHATWGRLASVGVPPADPAGRMKVQIRRLDTLVEQGLVPQPGVMKIDVEGSELPVLTGARRTIEASRPSMIIELHGTNAEMDQVLSELGYKSAVIGSALPVSVAHWNATILAIPSERADVLPLLEEIKTY